MAICPHCGRTLNVVGDLTIKRVTATKEVKMISCKWCEKVLGFSGD